MKIILEKCLLADQNSLANILIFNFLSQTYLTLSLSQEECLGFLSLTLPTFLSSVIFFIQNKGGPPRTHGPSPRSATALDYLALPFFEEDIRVEQWMEIQVVKDRKFLGLYKITFTNFRLMMKIKAGCCY